MTGATFVPRKPVWTLIAAIVALGAIAPTVGAFPLLQLQIRNDRAQCRRVPGLRRVRCDPRVTSSGPFAGGDRIHRRRAGRSRKGHGSGIVHSTGALEPKVVELGGFTGGAISQWLDCGYGVVGPNANAYRMTITLLLEIVPVDAGHSRLRVSLAAGGRDATVSSKSAVQCATTGQRGAKLSDLIEKRSSEP